MYLSTKNVRDFRELQLFPPHDSDDDDISSQCELRIAQWVVFGLQQGFRELFLSFIVGYGVLQGSNEERVHRLEEV